jgi:hypothetical protein
MVAPQIDGELLVMGAGPEVGERQDVPVALDDGHGTPRQVRLVEEPERETLFGAGLRREPVIGHRLELPHDRGHVRRVEDPEGSTFLLEPPQRLAILGRATALEGEARQVDLGFLPELEEHQAEVHVVVEL